MYYRPRIIPTLLIDDGRLVKTKQFAKARYLGDPINAIKIFNEKMVDELCVLDISASKNHKSPDFELLEKMASEAFMPLSYGGGINNVSQIKEIFRLGYEKVVIGTAFDESPDLIKEAVGYFGSQSIVVSVDYRKTFFGLRCIIADGTQKTKVGPLEKAIKAQEFGAGEILLYSIDNDGMRTGYDYSTIKMVSEQLSVPIIACGGADSLSDVSRALSEGKASAVAAGSIFVFFGKKEAVLINYPEEKDLIENGVYKI